MPCLPLRVDEIPDTFFADLTRANDSQACCESAELFWGRFEQASKILHYGAVPAHAFPPT